MASDKRIILITGANNGIGFDTAYALANASPNNHIIMSARTPSKGEQALEDVQARKPQGTLSFVQLDVTDDTSIANAVKNIESEFGRLDILVNNAGICVLQPTTTREQLRKTFDTNVFGAHLLAEAAAPILKKSKEPRIINVSSGLGSITNRLDPKDAYYHLKQNEAYRQSKAALNMVTASLTALFGDWGCKVCSFCPGYVVTDLTGPDQREARKQTGAESSETSAEGIRQIVAGERDEELNKFIKRHGEQYPW